MNKRAMTSCSHEYRWLLLALPSISVMEENKHPWWGGGDTLQPDGALCVASTRASWKQPTMIVCQAHMNHL